MMKHAGGEYVDAALDDTEATGDGEDQEGEAADMLGAEERRSTLPETNIASENQWLEDVFPFWDGPFLEDILVSGSVSLHVFFSTFFALPGSFPFCLPHLKIGGVFAMVVHKVIHEQKACFSSTTCCK